MIFVEYFFLLSNENNIGFKCIHQKIVSTNAPAKTFSARKDTLMFWKKDSSHLMFNEFLFQCISYYVSTVLFKLLSLC